MAARSVLRMIKNDDPLSLESYPEYVAERDKTREVGADLDRVSADLAATLGDMRRLSELVERRADEAARAYLENRQAPMRLTLTLDRERLDDEKRMLTAAFLMQSEQLAAVRERCVEEILKRAGPAHRRLLEDILQATIDLSAKLDAESDFRSTLARDGIGTGIWPHFAELHRSVGSRRHWASPVNALGRRLSKFLGREWDHSPVRY